MKYDFLVKNLYELGELTLQKKKITPEIKTGKKKIKLKTNLLKCKGTGKKEHGDERKGEHRNQ